MDTVEVVRPMPMTEESFKKSIAYRCVKDVTLPGVISWRYSRFECSCNVQMTIGYKCMAPVYNVVEATGETGWDGWEASIVGSAISGSEFPAIKGIYWPQDERLSFVDVEDLEEKHWLSRLCG